jgi:16S rRNA (cytosine967-C5)-methyltransferase
MAAAPPRSASRRRAPGARRAGAAREGAQPAGAGPRRERAEPVRLAAARAWLTFARGGAFAAEPPATLREEGQRRLYVQLLRGLVRHRRLLEAELARLADRPLARLDAEAAALALLGLYQLRFLEVPAHAAVYETVALAPALRVPRVKGWVNAILRAAQREGLRGTESPVERPLAVRTSHPDWLVERWTARYGAARAQTVCEADNRYEGAALRVETGRIAPQALLQRLADEGVAASRHGLLADALWCEQVGALLRTQAFREGLCYVQDVSSQLLIAWAAPLLQGRVLDACAAPGGKLTHLVGLRRPGTWAVGAELSAPRLAQVRENLQRLRLPATPLLRADARRLPCADGAWDAVLLDAPCSATGMIRKYPELKWRKHLEHLPALAATQAALLAEAARVVRPGGHVLYATCSLEPEENEGAVRAFLAARRDFRPGSFAALPRPAGLAADPKGLLSAAGELLLLPGPQQMGLYAAILQRRAA